MSAIGRQAVARAPEVSLGRPLKLQRKCACGASTPTGEMCDECKGKLQTKLAVGSADDPLEREADRIADQVMAPTPPSGVSAAPVSVRPDGTAGGATHAAPKSVERTLASDGQPLEPGLRHDMERRFGRDFFDVRIHSDARAQASARDIHAHAYTVDRHIVFGAGRFAPSTREGRHLIAHEIAHVVQQGKASETIRRQGNDPLGDLGLDDLGDLFKEAAKAAEEEVRRQLRAVSALPGTGAVFSKSGCPSNFCNPFKDVSEAKRNLVLTAPSLLAGVAKVVSPRVVPLWKDYLFGGSPPRNISSDFAADFTASRRTAKTANFIVKQLKKEIAASHKAIMGSAPSVTVDLTSRMPKTLAAIDDQNNANAMDFNVIGEIPGNIAGSIGKDQLSNKIGAQPSPFNDSRSVTITAQLTRTPSEIKVKPAIEFEVKDTIDLCPGNCGAVTEQDATIPMSRFEATGLSGDVPFTVQFSAPASALGDFAIPLAKGKPSPGKSKTPKKGKATSGAKGASLEPTQFPEEAVAANATEEKPDTNEEQIAGEESDLDGEQGVSV
jgi:hypothetical protein